MRNHTIFPITFIVLSVVAIVLRRINERAMMSVFGLQFGIFLTVIALANLELQFHYSEVAIITLFVCSCLIGLVFAFACFVSRQSSIMMLFLGAAVSTSYTLLSVLVMVTGIGISSHLFWIIIVSSTIFMVVLNAVPGFYDKYAHLYLVSIDFPFYIALSLSVLLGWYPDLLTIRYAERFKIGITPKKGNWWFIGG